ncbi:MAG: hypothetical protein COA36_17740 [Desulfotalea sp.]|nr:MAG: hypothetical protein COA36_17740 [Desulfotalea sp.]
MSLTGYLLKKIEGKASIQISTVIQSSTQHLRKPKNLLSSISQQSMPICLTGVTLETALKASHIKPWSQCDNKDHLEPNNGLLLVANANSLFDSGLISFDASGKLIKSKFLAKDELVLLLGSSKFSLSLN